MCFAIILTSKSWLNGFAKLDKDVRSETNTFGQASILNAACADKYTRDNLIFIDEATDLWVMHRPKMSSFVLKRTRWLS
jgi:hypothetical protein